MKFTGRSRVSLRFALAIAAVALMGLASCNAPAKSLAPLYTEKDLVLDDTIVGVWHPKEDRYFSIEQEWVSSPATYTIEKSRDVTDKG